MSTIGRFSDRMKWLVLVLALGLGHGEPEAIAGSPNLVRMPDCAVEQARRAHEPVQDPRIRRNNTAKQLIASKNRITRIKIWSRWHRGVVGELDEAEVATLIAKLGSARIRNDEWTSNAPSWDAVLLIYTRGNELPFAVHPIDQESLRVGHSEPMSTAIWEESVSVEGEDEEMDEDGEMEEPPAPRIIAQDIYVDHDLFEILPRFLGPEDPFNELQFEREREIQRRCHPHSDIGDDPFPHLPMARIEPADP